jgi:hypothetical protein
VAHARLSQTEESSPLVESRVIFEHDVLTAREAVAVDDLCVSRR